MKDVLAVLIALVGAFVFRIGVNMMSSKEQKRFSKEMMNKMKELLNKHANS